MPRKSRGKSPSEIYHVTMRGTNKNLIFEDKTDYRRFIETLYLIRERSNCQIFAYCLMDNHIHLLLKEGDEPLGNTVKRIADSYVYWYNRRYERIGHLFQERFHSEPIYSLSHFLNAFRYIFQNPVSAGIAENITDYEWSNFIFYCSQNMPNVDYEFAKSLFSTTQDLIDFCNIPCNHFRAYEPFERFHDSVRSSKTDKQAIKLIKRTLSIESVAQISALPRDERNEYLRMLKDKGISQRQISRLTGCSRGVIARAWE